MHRIGPQTSNASGLSIDLVRKSGRTPGIVTDTPRNSTGVVIPLTSVGRQD